MFSSDPERLLIKELQSISTPAMNSQIRFVNLHKILVPPLPESSGERNPYPRAFTAFVDPAHQTCRRDEGEPPDCRVRFEAERNNSVEAISAIRSQISGFLDSSERPIIYSEESIGKTRLHKDSVARSAAALHCFFVILRCSHFAGSSKSVTRPVAFMHQNNLF